MWVMFPPETDCMALFSQSLNSGLSNDIRSLDEDIMTAEGLLFEPLPVSLGVLQGCVLDSVIIYYCQPVILQLHPGFLPLSDLIFLMQSIGFLRKLFNKKKEKKGLSLLVLQQWNIEAIQV